MTDLIVPVWAQLICLGGLSFVAGWVTTAALTTWVSKRNRALMMIALDECYAEMMKGEETND